MELKTILKVIKKHMGVSPQEVLMGDKTRAIADARKVLAYIVYTNEKSYKLLVYSSNRTGAAWTKCRNAMYQHLEANDGLARTYHEIVQDLSQIVEKKKEKQQPQKELAATPFGKWTVLDEIKIEAAMQSALAFMNKYGRV